MPRTRNSDERRRRKSVRIVNNTKANKTKSKKTDGTTKNKRYPSIKPSINRTKPTTKSTTSELEFDDREESTTNYSLSNVPKKPTKKGNESQTPTILLNKPDPKSRGMPQSMSMRPRRRKPSSTPSDNTSIIEGNIIKRTPIKIEPSDNFISIQPRDELPTKKRITTPKKRITLPKKLSNIKIEPTECDNK